MTTAPIAADISETMTRVSNHPNSPGASAKKKIQKLVNIKYKNRLRKEMKNVKLN